MDNTAQRSYVKIRFQLGDSPSVIHSDLKTSQRETPVSLRTVQRWCKALEKGTFKGLWRPRQRRTSFVWRNCSRRTRNRVFGRFHQAFPSHKQQFTGSSRSIWNSGTFFSYGCPITSVTTTNVGEWSAVRIYWACSTAKPWVSLRHITLLKTKAGLFGIRRSAGNAWIEKKQTKPTVTGAKITTRKTMLLVAITCKPNGTREPYYPQDIQLTQMLPSSSSRTPEDASARYGET